MAQRPQEAPHGPGVDDLTVENRWNLEAVDL